MTTYTLGFSPCPNDTFIFDALVNGKIDTGDLNFEPVLLDVEELNQRAVNGVLDITKLSFNALMHLTDKYRLLDSGAALGWGVGPLLIARPETADLDPRTARIAIPGERTTANFLMGFAYNEAQNKVPMLFSDIEEAVLHGEVDMGVIIHENRFTYADKGLMKVRDLGEYWEAQTGHAIPLGGIAANSRIEPKAQKQIERLLRLSVEYARNNPEQTEEYVRCHAQEMERAVMYQHIDLYVNDYTVTLGENGRAAVDFMRAEMLRQGLIDSADTPLYVSA